MHKLVLLFLCSLFWIQILAFSSVLGRVFLYFSADGDVLTHQQFNDSLATRRYVLSLVGSTTDTTRYTLYPVEFLEYHNGTYFNLVSPSGIRIAEDIQNLKTICTSIIRACTNVDQNFDITKIDYLPVSEGFAAIVKLLVDDELEKTLL